MRDFWQFLMENKAWWITPTVLVLVLLVALIWSTSGDQIAPFVYSLF
jgi:Family of unknown function (DUF5989)